MDPIFQEFTAQGQNLFVALGDAGAYTGSNATDNGYPAESVYLVAVGGTDLGRRRPNGRRLRDSYLASWCGEFSESGFNDCTQRADVSAEANIDNYTCDQGSCLETTAAQVLPRRVGRDFWR